MTLKHITLTLSVLLCLTLSAFGGGGARDKNFVTGGDTLALKNFISSTDIQVKVHATHKSDISKTKYFIETIGPSVNQYRASTAIQGGDYYIDGGLSTVFTVEIKRTYIPTESTKTEVVTFNKEAAQAGMSKGVMGNTLNVKLTYNTQLERWELEFS